MSKVVSLITRRRPGTAPVWTIMHRCGSQSFIEFIDASGHRGNPVSEAFTSRLRRALRFLRQYSQSRSEAARKETDEATPLPPRRRMDLGLSTAKNLSQQLHEAGYKGCRPEMFGASPIKEAMRDRRDCSKNKTGHANGRFQRGPKPQRARW